MKVKLIIILPFCLMFQIWNSYLYGQNAQWQKRMFYTALDQIYNMQYDKALDILLHLDSIKLEHYLNSSNDLYFVDKDTVRLEKIFVKYFIGNCYLEKKYEKEKTIPYIEYVMKSGYSATPDIIYKDLGTLYHLNYQFEKAIFYLNKYLQKIKPSDEYYNYSCRLIDICKNAMVLVADTVRLRITKLTFPVNTTSSETKPFVSSDDLVLVYLKIEYKEHEVKGSTVVDSTVQIMISKKEMGIWKKPYAINTNKSRLSGSFNLAGLSPDGKEIYITQEIEKQTDIYSGKIENNAIKEFKLFAKTTSKLNEHSICFSSDGREIIFSSNRPGGYGGYDLYKMAKIGQGRWSAPENLGKLVNTSLDEIYPTLNVRRSNLYFSSNGGKTMGGFDIFKCTLDSTGNWGKRENMGFPINTTRNNLSFSVSELEDLAYFTGSQFDKYDQQDIFSVYLLKNIPLTFLNGTIRNVVTSLPLDAKIRIINYDTVSPNLTISHKPKGNVGKYYLFFPPGKEYDLLIESKDFFPQLIRISIPEQDYFYMLHQEITIKPIKTLNKTLGEQVTVRNIFSDFEPSSKDSANNMNNINLQDVEKMKQTIKEIVSYAESHKSETGYDNTKNKDYSKLMNFIDDAINQQDTTSLFALNNSVISEESYSQTYFYNEEKSQTELFQVQMGKDAFYTAPPLNAFTKKKGSSLITQQIDKNNYFHDTTNVKLKNAVIDTIIIEKKKIFTYQVLFKTGSSEVESNFKKELMQIIDLLIDNPKLFIEINGYANSVGLEENNMELSKTRAFAVKQQFLQSQISDIKLRTSYFGELYSTNEVSEEDKAKNRRVDIFVYEQNKIVKYKAADNN